MFKMSNIVKMVHNHGKSFWYSPLPTNFEWSTVPQMIDYWSKESPDKEAFVVRNHLKDRQAVTFKQLQCKIDIFAKSLIAMGLSKGDFVMLAGMTCLEWILCDLACATTGVITIRCRVSLLTRDVLIDTTRKNNVKALFFHPGENDELKDFLLNASAGSCLEVFSYGLSSGGRITCDLIPSVQYIIDMNHLYIAAKHLTNDWIEKGTSRLNTKDATKEVTISPDDVRTVLMTSRSTGLPKAIPVTHFKPMNMFIKTRFFIQKGDRVFNECPLCWMESMMHLPVCFGVTIVYVPPLSKSSPEKLDYGLQV